MDRLTSAIALLLSLVLAGQVAAQQRVTVHVTARGVRPFRGAKVVVAPIRQANADDNFDSGVTDRDGNCPATHIPSGMGEVRIRVIIEKRRVIDGRPVMVPVFSIEEIYRVRPTIDVDLFKNASLDPEPTYKLRCVCVETPCGVCCCLVYDRVQPTITPESRKIDELLAPQSDADARPIAPEGFVESRGSGAVSRDQSSPPVPGEPLFQSRCPLDTVPQPETLSALTVARKGFVARLSVVRRDPEPFPIPVRVRIPFADDAPARPFQRRARRAPGIPVARVAARLGVPGTQSDWKRGPESHALPCPAGDEPSGSDHYHETTTHARKRIEFTTN